MNTKHSAGASRTPREPFPIHNTASLETPRSAGLAVKLLLFLAALAAEGRWRLHRCENYRQENPKNAHTDPKIIPSAPIRSNSNSSVLQSLSCAQAPCSALLLPDPCCYLPFRPRTLPPCSHMIGKWETAQAPHSSSL